MTSRMALSAIWRDGAVSAIAHVEGEVDDVLDVVVDAEVDLDDVAVAGDHQAFVGIVGDDVLVAAW